MRQGFGLGLVSPPSALGGEGNPIAGSGPALSPLAAGEALGGAVAWGSYGPAGVAVTRQMQRDGGPWVAFAGGTLVAEAEVWRVREVVALGPHSRIFASPGRTVQPGDAAFPAHFQAVNADGWSVSYASPPTFDPENAPEYVTVMRAGFDGDGQAVTRREDLVCTKRVRQPWPNHASLTADRVALSDYVYSTDSIAGVVNNSAEASPRPVANWARPDRVVVGNSIPAGQLEIVAFHRNARAGEQVACVEWTISDGTGSVTVRASASVVSDYAGDRNAVIVYRPAADVDISGLADPATLTVNARVYPWVGDAASVLDSADGAVAREFSPRTFRRDTVLAAAPRLAYVRTTGNDGTGAVSTDPAIAAAAPFATVLAAINAHHAAGGLDGAVIHIGQDGGTPFVLGNPIATRTQSHAPLVITREPGVPRAEARVSFGAASFRPRLGAGLLLLRDVGVVRTGTSSFQGESGAHLRVVFEDVALDNGGFNSGWLNNCHDLLIGVDLSNMAAAPLNAAGAVGVTEHRMVRGVSCPAAAANVEGWLVLGCDLRGSSTLTLQRGARSRSGSIVAFNRLQGPATSTRLWAPAQDEDVVGAAFAQNVVEYLSATATTTLSVSADAAASNNAHVILHHNTIAGFNAAGRSNLFYDEGATARTSKLHSCRGNIHVQINTKGDVFRGANEAGGDASSRTGNWSFLYGVGCRGEWSQFIDAAGGGPGTSFAQAWGGLDASLGTSASLRNDPLFVDYQASSPAAGAGGGDYRLQPGSPARARVASVLRWDLAGTPRSAVLASAGAYE